MGLSLLLIIGVATMLVKLNAKDDSNPDQKKTAQSEKDSTFAQQHLQGCKQRDVSFTASPVPIDQMGYLEPMGKTSDGHVTPTDHVYIAPKSMNAADNTTDVVAPADGTVTVVSAMPSQYIGDRQQQTAAEDHRLVVTHNCRYVSIFIHIHQLSDALKKAVGTLAPNDNKMTSIEVKAGDKLGKIGGNPVDWSLMDATKTLSGFITPSLYDGESWKVHVIDPISVYSGELATQLTGKSLRTSAPFGGKIDYDKAGALVGNWFKEGTNGYRGRDMNRYWDGHFSIAPNYIDPSGTTVSIGNWQGKAAQFTAKAGSLNPADVTAKNGVVKFELVPVGYTTAEGTQPLSPMLTKGARLTQTGDTAGTLLLQVQPGEKLKLERFPGKTAAQVTGFTDAAVTYKR